MFRVLTLDGSMATCSAGLVEGEAVLGCREADGNLAVLPSLVESLLTAHGRHLDLVAVTVGPGSFTGLRASIALAHGIGLAANVPVIGVTVGRAMTPREPGPFWCVIDSKRGRVFLERDGHVESLMLDDIPVPPGLVTLGGDAALAVGERLAGQGADIRLLPISRPDPLGIARAARAADTRPPQPLYVDPPAARPGPPGRPAPA